MRDATEIQPRWKRDGSEIWRDAGLCKFSQFSRNLSKLQRINLLVDFVCCFPHSRTCRAKSDEGVSCATHPAAMHAEPIRNYPQLSEAIRKLKFFWPLGHQLFVAPVSDKGGSTPPAIIPQPASD